MWRPRGSGLGGFVGEELGLDPGPRLREPAEPAGQRTQLRLDLAGLYHGRGGHLAIFGCPHNTG
jgi:hypothetical protein